MELSIERKNRNFHHHRFLNIDNYLFINPKKHLPTYHKVLTYLVEHYKGGFSVQQKDNQRIVINIK